MNKKIEDVIQWMREIVREAKCDGLVFGLSGGIDSAVIAGLAKKAFPDNCLGVIMPIDSIEEDEEDARLVAEALNLETVKVDLTETFHSLISNSFKSENRMALSNIKPRLRMTTLYYYAQDRKYLVCGSSNASEYYVGYFTKHGDSGADLLPLVDFVKGEVVEMARALNIPEKVIEKKPSAGLYKGQTDELDMGFSYEELDKVVKNDFDGPNRKKIDHMHRVSEHKRVSVPQYKQK